MIAGIGMFLNIGNLRTTLLSNAEQSLLAWFLSLALIIVLLGVSIFARRMIKSPNSDNLKQIRRLTAAFLVLEVLSKVFHLQNISDIYVSWTWLFFVPIYLFLRKGSKNEQKS
ncbi:hypothetical protein XA3_16080 [Xylocopilactobacillus apicola]|uniref:Uncharacterized protein n=2 Tax=Xylocopilactobacillus apicola TaxID=2932184 RepID=A0AAU9CYS5_9LACO|nr:hypothetical protein XA3_16080 [Xylocopilactobacillus apicola]